MSGCGKSILLRTMNRMNDIIPGSRVTGKINGNLERIGDHATSVAEAGATGVTP
jgi:ABC-type phosphate transport system ATPase subunit